MSTVCKTAASLLAVLAMGGCLAATPALAASSITFEGQDQGFSAAPGTEYHATDLFDGFKAVMPGDELGDTVTFVNAATDCDFVDVYLRAVPHDEEGNPIASAQVAAGETVASMNDFLAQLNLTVSNGGQVVFDGAPNEAGSLGKGVYLGRLRSGESLVLDLALSVPLDLGNDYANRMGEVDWVFSVAAFDDPVQLTVVKSWDDGNDSDRPAAVYAQLRNAGEPVRTVQLSAANNWGYTFGDLDADGDWSVVEVSVPNGYVPSYRTVDGVTTITNTAKLIQTGQLNWPIPVLLAGGAAVAGAGVWLIVGKRRTNGERA